MQRLNLLTFCLIAAITAFPAKGLAFYSELHSLMAYEASLVAGVPSEIRVFGGDPAYCITGLSDTVCQGSYDEDADRDPRLTGGLGVLWGLLNWGTHFWDPQGGPSGGLLTNVAGFPVNLESQNAYQRAAGLYTEAVNRYSDDPFSAYYVLGRVAHLLTDMATPAHVHLDPHISDESPTGDDSFEEFTAARYVFPGPVEGRIMFESDLPPSVFLPADYRSLSDGGYSGEPPLFRLFYSMASLSDTFDSDDADGRVDGGSRRGVSIPLSRNDLTGVVAFGPGGQKTLTEGYGVAASRNKFILLNAVVQSLLSGNPYYDGIELVFSDSTSEVHSLSEFVKTDIDDMDAAAIGDVLLPRAVNYLAGLYELFWTDTHPAITGDTPMVTINGGQYLMNIGRPAPIDIRVDVQPAGWQNKEVEVFAWAEVPSADSRARFYFDGGAWSGFQNLGELKPAVRSFALVEITNFLWRIFDDTSLIPPGISTLSICFDRFPDGRYTPSESICSGAEAYIR